MNEYTEAVEYARSYNGDFSFMVDMQRKCKAQTPSLTDGMIAAILRCKDRDTKTKTSTVVAKPTFDGTQVIQDGRYTVVFNGDDEDYATIRISSVTERSSAPQGTQKLGYLYGPDNTSQFTVIAYVFGDRFVPFKDSSRYLVERYGAAFRAVLAMSKDEQADSRELYAMKSGKCARCGRDLTVPTSLHRGIGPECFKKMEF